MSTQGPGKVIHRTKLFGGVETAEEIHSRIAWFGRVCGRCKGPPAVHARVFVPLDWFLTNHPGAAMRLSAANEGRLPVAEFTMGRYVRTGDYFACSRCRRGLERFLAKGPSFAVVHFDYGPGPDKPIVQVG